MPIRLSYTRVYDTFEKEGYKLLSKSYKNNSTKLKFLCSNGHNHSITFDAFTNQGQRCSICSQKKKHILNEIKEIFNKNRWKLLSKIYINNKQLLNVLCNKGHKTRINLNNFLNGWRCKSCFIIRNSGKNSIRWNPNLSDKERILERDIPENTNWIKEVLKQDNYQCQCCYEEGNGYNLNAHHLEGYHWCKELRFEVNNGITLCKKCHKEFHRLFGNKWNTSEQFYQFLRINNET